MCGLAGLLFNSKEYPVQDEIIKMTKALSHRGPDQVYYFQKWGAVMGFRRLKVRDLEGAAEVFSSLDGRFRAYINGEIYNYEECKQHLELKGITLKTKNDCEVVVHLFFLFREKAFSYLRGMFAITLFDTKLKKLYLVTDQAGEKPIYYAKRQEAFIYASELKVLLLSRSIDLDIDPQALWQYLHFGYVPQPRSMIQGVSKIPPATILEVSHEREVTSQTYQPVSLTGSEEESLEILFESIGNTHYEADVSLGIGLSGGLDSHLLLAQMVQNKKDVTAFSVGYKGDYSFDETKEAESFAKEMKVPFIRKKISEEHVLSQFSRLCYDRDEPCADYSGFGYDAIMQAAKEAGCKVMVLGHGGDELFWGYEWVQRAARELTKKSQQDFHLSDFFSFSPTFQNAEQHLKNFLHEAIYLDLKGKQLFEFMKPIFSSTEIPYRVTEAICKSYLFSNGILQADRLSMAHSIEARLPLLDPFFLSRVLELQKEKPDHMFASKERLKRIAKNYLPQEVVNRPKRGFTVPFQKWNKLLLESNRELLFEGKASELSFFDKDKFKKFYSRSYDAPGIPISAKILTFAVWYEAMSKSLKDKSKRPFEFEPSKVLDCV